MNRINIIGCGDTGALWDGKGYSIGVNDCYKFGKPVDALVTLDAPHKFKPDRLKTILETPCKQFFSCVSEWSGMVKNFQILDTTRWKGKISDEDSHFYHSLTSPFVAIQLAWLGMPTEIVLWGVDFINHDKFSEGKDIFREEKNNYWELFEELEKRGTFVYLGAPGALSSICNQLPD